MFLHGGFAHLIGNMLFLWIFGDDIEDAFGRAVRRLLSFCGIVGALVSLRDCPDAQRAAGRRVRRDRRRDGRLS